MYSKIGCKEFTKQRFWREGSESTVTSRLQEDCLRGEDFLLKLTLLYDDPAKHHCNSTTKQFNPKIFKFILYVTASFRTN